MFIADSFVFIELHKTGTTHISKFLSSAFTGVHQAKHQPAPPELLASNRKFLGSVRNPWSWYNSLWAFGCMHSGALFKAVTNPDCKHAEAWLDTYKDVQDTERFRQWLKMLHDPGFAANIEATYLNPDHARPLGLLTSRYVKLFSRPEFRKKAYALPSTDALLEFDERHGYVSFFIRTENLEQDLIRGLEHVGSPLDETQVNKLLSSKRSNTSLPRKKLHEYYDAETAALVARQDEFILRKFNYTPPACATS